MFRTDQFRKRATLVGVALWIPAVAFGLNVLWRYSSTPGRPAAPPLEWPARGGISRAPGRATLLMFLHPQCECSRATIGELSILMAHSGGRLDADLFFYLPPSESDAWARTDLWRRASEIPAVRVFEDRDAEIARSFGSFTSGQTLLYDGAGRLQFKGGITAFRGHSGDNAGRAAITALLQGERTASGAAPVVTPVFGCSLRGE